MAAQVPRLVSMERAEVEKGSLEGRLVALLVSFRRAGSIPNPTFSLGVLVSLGMSPAATTGLDGCNTFSHPKNFRALPSSTGSGAQCALDTSVVQRVCRLSSSSFSGRATPQKISSFSEGEVPFHLLPQLQNAFCQ